MRTINIIFPNQLFENSCLLNQKFSHYLIEEHLFFKQYNFHKQKIYFQRCSMKNYFDFLQTKQLKFNILNHVMKIQISENLFQILTLKKLKRLYALTLKIIILKEELKKVAIKRVLRLSFTTILCS